MLENSTTESRLDSHLRVAEPMDVHCHGLGKFDFSQMVGSDLLAINNILSQRKQRAILTLYLPKNHFEKFQTLIRDFSQLKEQGELKQIAGLGLEGPLLASDGGTPKHAIWKPTDAQWHALADCGARGLVYVILSPDAYALAEMRTIISVLLQGGVLPAPGHFCKNNPDKSALALQAFFDAVAEFSSAPTITDHFLNDMPQRIKHAWRTKSEKVVKEEEILALNIDTWCLDNIEEILGPVPAVFIKNAKLGRAKLAMNFDGEHVELAIVKKMVEIIGAENIVLMTDSVERNWIAGCELVEADASTLLYRQDGVVAVGTQGLEQQIINMRTLGLSEREIQLISKLVPEKVLYSQREHYEQKISCI